jgi:hypothetical protein
MRKTIHKHIRYRGDGVNLVADVNLGVSASEERRTKMAKRKPEREGNEALSRDEIESQSGEQLPDREQMSLINANVAAPINLALAANVLSDGSVAYANAEQTAPITQTNL